MALADGRRGYERLRAGGGMRSPDEIRDELDRKVTVLRPAAADRAPGEARQLAALWADDIELSLEAGGVVDGLMPRTGLTVVYGESGCGKTFNVLDLACHVAAGLPWRGLQVEQGPVVYIAAEAPKSVERRVWAWKRHHKIERLPLLIVQSSVDLLNGDCEAVLERVRQVEEERGRVALTVVDTLARAMTGNENAPDDMGRFVAACSRIREAGDTHVLVVHHSGKDTAKGARGHSCLRAATDVELEVTNGEAGGCIKVTKSRDDMGGRTFGFRLETVELGTNTKGRTVTTCVTLEADAPAREERKPKPRPRRLGDVEKIVLECLDAALADHGRPAEEAGAIARDIPRHATVVRRDALDRAADRYMADRAGNKRREATGRAIDSLQARGMVKHVDGWLWRPSHDVA